MRVPPALLTQREFRKAHGDRIAADLDLDKIGFPIMNLRDGHYWVLDGQHRLYALKQFGFSDTDTIDCEVYENLTDPEMAEIFLGRDARRAIGQFDKFHVACTAGRSRETDVRRTVESNGLKLGRTKEENTIGAIGALCKVYDRAGALVLGQTLRTLRDAFAGDPRSFSPELIEGIGLVYNRYNGKTNEKMLAVRLSETRGGVRNVINRAEAQRERTNNQKAQCVAATVVDIYNSGAGPRAKERLQQWWKLDAPAEHEGVAKQA
jgi:hypothetical protein